MHLRDKSPSVFKEEMVQGFSEDERLGAAVELLPWGTMDEASGAVVSEPRVCQAASRPASKPTHPSS